MISTITVGLTQQIRVVSALLLREFRLRNSKNAFSQFFDLLEAVLFIVGHWIIFTFLHRNIMIGDSLLLFITTGILPVLLFRTISTKTASAIEASKSVTRIPTIFPIDYSIARSLMELLTFSITFILFFMMIYIFNLSRFAVPYKMEAILQFLAMIYVFAFGMGLVNSFMIYLFPAWKFIWAGFSRVQIFFSAVFFIPEYMPPQLRNLLAYNPIMHFVSLFRSAFYSTYPTHLISLKYMLGWTIGAIMVGLAMERALRMHRTQ